MDDYEAEVQSIVDEAMYYIEIAEEVQVLRGINLYGLFRTLGLGTEKVGN